MANILRSLDTISNVYSIFEKDQVLTEQQLNDVTSYLDDQNRLTRVNLTGIGIVCGLRATLQGNQIVIGKGVGITSDGDLIYVDADTSFDRYKLYDDTNPVYAPFYVDNALLTIYELIAQGATDDRATDLAQFNSLTQQNLNSMVVVALMESYAKDNDICSGTDCDNLGKDCVNTIKILLLDKSNVSALLENITTPHSAYSQLDTILVDRPILSGGFTSLTDLAKPYRDACLAIHTRLTTALGKIFPACAGFIADVFAQDPAPTWIKNLENLKNSVFGTSNFGIQYYYDYLKDVVETYHALRDCLFGDRSLCCPTVNAFPKHILLGNLVPGVKLAENRTAFYPSPALTGGDDSLRHAKFLLRKLDVQLNAFNLPAFASAPILITPSYREQRSLEERAIPYYYAINSTTPLQTYWNYPLYRRQMGDFNYSYHAAEYAAQGAAANPLNASIGGFDFFRIEGHLGKNVTSVVNSLSSLIKSKNLPISVQAVFLGTDKGKIIIKPPIRYTDLHRFHYLLRQDLVFQMNDVKTFSSNFKTKVDAAVAAGTVNDTADGNDGTTVKTVAAQKDNTIQSKSALVTQKLNLPYTQYKADLSWKTDLNDTMLTAGEFKNDLAKVVKTEFNTPFDNLIGNTNSRWLDWLDDIIKHRDDKKDDKLLFGNFLGEHPGAEHFAGVTPGGTFVLIYDDNNNVMADCMLNYYVCDSEETTADEPGLTAPTVKPGWLIQNGINLLPSLDKFVGTKLNTFKLALDTELTPKFDTQQQYFNVVKDSIDMIGTVFTGKQLPPDIIAPGVSAGGMNLNAYQDKQLGYYTVAADNNKQLLAYYDTQLSQPGLDAAAKADLQSKRDATQTDLVKSLDTLGSYVAAQPQDVTVGSESYNSMVVLSQGVQSVQDTAALNTLKTNITGVTGATQKLGFGSMVNMIFTK
jgi:hypothetical protein